jgi:hypothetical protein
VLSSLISPADLKPIPSEPAAEREKSATMSREDILKVQVSSFVWLLQFFPTRSSTRIPRCMTMVICCCLLQFRDVFFLSVCQQTLELKVPIHCDGCLKKVKKIVQKIDGKFLD